MSVDYRKRAIVTMRCKSTGAVKFDLVVYGVEARDLMTVPNATIAALAAKYPDHQSTPWDIR